MAPETASQGVQRMPKRLGEGQPRKHPQLTVIFEPDVLEKLDNHARRKGLSPSTLLRMWAIERLEQEEKGERL